MLPRALRLCFVLACVLAIALVAMQVRSYATRDFFKSPQHGTYATSETGRLAFIVYDWPGWPRWASATVRVPQEYMHVEFTKPGTSYNPGARLGSFVAVAWPGEASAPWILIAPHSLLALPIVGASLLAWRLAARRERRRRASVGCCTSCGYDLRASPERCPECGARTA